MTVAAVTRILPLSIALPTAILLLLPIEVQGQGAIQSVRERARQAATGRTIPGSDRRGEKPKPEKWNASGRVHSLDRGAINMMNEAQLPWRVQLDKNTQFKVNGEAGPEALMPRSAVRFEAMLSKRGIGVEPISEITVFTPRPGFQPVVDEVASESNEEGQAAAPEQPQAATLADLGIGSGSNNKQSRRTRDKDQDDKEAKRYSIVGMLLSARRGKLTVDVGKDKVRVELADDAKVTVDLDQLLARPGDAITVTGNALPQEYQRGNFGVATAKTVEITLATPKPKEDEKDSTKKRGATTRKSGSDKRRSGKR